MSRVLLPVLALALGALTACGGDDGGTGEDTTLTVYAAASLTATFEQLAADFEAEHEDVEVELSFGGSSDLATQLVEGASADVFASADTAAMDDLVAAGLTADDPRDFATNTLVIAVPPGNPAGVRSLQDLTGDLALVLCSPEVPCGAAAQGVAELAGLTLSPVSEEQSVTDVLAKVTSGEADAGLVYVTDVAAAGADVEGIGFPEAARVVNTYPIAPVAGSDEAGLAQELVDLVLGETGQSVLRDAGFGAP